MIRLCVPHASEGVLRIDGPQLHYLARVHRVTVGEAVEVFDGRGHVFPATVTQLMPEEGTLTLSAARAIPPSRHVTVVQGLPKSDKFEWIVQKVTELGANAVLPAQCVRSVSKIADNAEKKVQRWQRIAEEAARQCGRADVPIIHAPARLPQALAALPTDAAVLVLDEEERSVPLSAALAEAAARPVALVVGPEGGLAREEVQWLLQRGGTAVTLGARVLRTETAALAALCVIRHFDGELG